MEVKFGLESVSYLWVNTEATVLPASILGANEKWVKLQSLRDRTQVLEKANKTGEMNLDKKE